MEHGARGPSRHGEVAGTGEQELPGGDDWLTAARGGPGGGDALHQATHRVPPASLGLQAGRRRGHRAPGRSPVPGTHRGHQPAQRRAFVLVDGGEAGLDVSLTDRAGWAVCLVGSGFGRVGCDLEIVEPRSRGFVADFLTDRRAGVRRRSTRHRAGRGREPDLVGQGERAQGAADRSAPGHPQRRGRRRAGHEDATGMGRARPAREPSRAACCPAGGGGTASFLLTLAAEQPLPPPDAARRVRRPGDGAARALLGGSPAVRVSR